MKINYCKIIYSWFYLGYSPVAPGTVGTLGAIPLVYFLSKVSLNGYFIVLLPFYFMGIEAADIAEITSSEHDPKYVVIDEVMGFMVTMFGIDMNWQNILIGLFLFRIFDIFKPYPISWIDRNIRGGHGVMLDDVLAGLMSCLLLHLLSKYISF